MLKVQCSIHGQEMNAGPIAGGLKKVMKYYIILRVHQSVNEWT